MCYCKGTEARGHACLEASSWCAACACGCHHPSSPRGLTAAGKLRWDGLSKLPCGGDAIRNGPLNQTLWGASMERRALEIWDFDDSCYLTDCLLGLLWVGLCFEGVRCQGEGRWVPLIAGGGMAGDDPTPSITSTSLAWVWQWENSEKVSVMCKMLFVCQTLLSWLGWFRACWDPLSAHRVQHGKGCKFSGVWPGIDLAELQQLISS